MMKILKISLHSFVMVIINFTAILTGFLVFKFLRSSDQIYIQIPVALLLSILLFISWNWLIKILSLKRLFLKESQEFFLTFFASLLWSPLIFVPVHYLITGYLTSIGNIVAVLFLQIFINSIALSLTKLVCHMPINTE